MCSTTIRYYDEDLLARFGMLDDNYWLFARGSMSHFLELKEHTYRDLTLEFLSTLHVKVTRGSQCQAGYISFYLQGHLWGRLVQVLHHNLLNVFEISFLILFVNYIFASFWAMFGSSLRFESYLCLS